VKSRKAVLPGGAEKKCLLTTPSLLSKGTLIWSPGGELQKWCPLLVRRGEEKLRGNSVGLPRRIGNAHDGAYTEQMMVWAWVGNSNTESLK
jgi:hypothetical protein